MYTYVHTCIYIYICVYIYIYTYMYIYIKQCTALCRSSTLPQHKHTSNNSTCSRTDSTTYIHSTCSVYICGPQTLKVHVPSDRFHHIYALHIQIPPHICITHTDSTTYMHYTRNFRHSKSTCTQSAARRQIAISRLIATACS